ncbi:hypothetical protein NQ315_008086 [Exocentrus adspersus]|uniref:XPG N-terminal domain-containing protein n=1 Tax=Exocentrus adspersus TaxID=1586481 RepID=A0AAV8VW74_9CUCU|nr:hypothetical protein NQ315_008086 [Exocentrus adspersus]
MGIRGLTTFIQNRSNLYLEEYELHDTSLVIDGNAIACQLYKWHCKSNDCFGGDYDKYAAVVENLFEMLNVCNVTPYVIFDGGYETRKVATIISRMKNRIQSAQQLSSVTEHSVSVFPLFLRETFLDVLIRLNIKCVRCDFECDTEIANIARTLNCPIYRVEKFLKSFGGLDKKNLPILAVLLGNDYVKRSAFSMFFNNLKMQKCHGNQSNQQKIIKSLIVWLQNESAESAVKKVLSRYKCRRRQFVFKKIQAAIKGYNCTDSIYLRYLGITPVRDTAAVEINVDICSIDKENSEEISEKDLSDSEEGTSSATDEDEIDFNFDNEEPDLDIPSIFSDKYRRCLLPPCFMDILIQNKYYSIPQIENDALEYSHAVSSEILSAIQRILRGSGEDNLICLARNNNGQNVGMCSTRKELDKKINKLNASPTNIKKTIRSDKTGIIDALENISYNDSLMALDRLYSNFHMDVKMETNHRLFDRNVVHSMAQFQSCLLHLKYLNNLLNLPFASFIASDIFNGTFIYNLTINFMKRPNLDNYIALIFKDSPTVLDSVTLVIKEIRRICENSVICTAPPRRRRKKKKRKEADVVKNCDSEDCSDSDKEECCLDPNNKYSALLSIL